MRKQLVQSGILSITLALVGAGAVETVCAATSPERSIKPHDVKDVDFKQVEGSGQGTLDIIMLTGNGVNENKNNDGDNYDNGNIELPNKGGAPSNFDGSVYVTSFGELRNFYDKQFLQSTAFTYGDDGIQGTADDRDESDVAIVLFFDTNETGGDMGISADEIDMFAGVTFPTGDVRNDPWTNDITKDQQAEDTPEDPDGVIDNTLIDRNYLINNNRRYLRDLDTAEVVGLNAQGNGIPDAVAMTFVNPFERDSSGNYAFADDENFVLWWKSSQHTSGGEDVFLSGKWASADLNAGIPLPPAIASIPMLLPFAWFWYRRRSAA
ncbi:MAG: hypothetical protein R3336_02565 [Phycisphaeraceae bacterium]|nr:hypothetical protein [Phycisphaeraceae bacterium]